MSAVSAVSPVPTINSTLQSWLDLFLQRPCPLCQRSAPQTFCRDCQHQLKQCQHALNQGAGPVRQSAQPRGNLAGKSVEPTTAQTLRVVSWGEYREALKRAIGHLKYDQQAYLAQPLGRWLGQAWQQQVGPHAPTLTAIPIPLHSSKLRQRGYNQASLIAQAFCRQTGYPLWEAGLIRVQATEAQFKLSREQRLANVRSAFQVPAQVANRARRQSSQILLIDDIYTTGATAHAAAASLRQAGFTVWGIAAVASTRRP
jgi:ComF family protein